MARHARCRNIEDKDRDVEKLDDNGNYIITVPEGYKFQIHINEYDDVEVDYIGKEDNLLPYISAITVVNQTTNSVELQVSVTRLNGGTLSYYYKVKGELDENYQLAKGNTTDLTANITGLTDKTTYEIKVEATNENGTTEKITEVLIGELKGTINQKGETQWNNGTATIYLETQVPNVSILYQINSTEGTYLPYDDTQGITGLEHGDTVFAVLSDGTNITDYTSINIEDDIPPQSAIIALGSQTVKEGEIITATVTHIDNESGVQPTNCKWVYNTRSTTIGTEESSYLNTFNSNGQTINLTASTAGTYYLHVLTIDKAGNKIETISNPITVTAANRAPVIASVSLNKKTTNSITVNAQATDADNNNLTYTLYTSTSKSSGFTQKAKSAATTSGTQVTLTASGLSQYTNYYYYITVTDGTETVQGSTSTAVRTFCPGNTEYCSGGREESEDCSRCGGTGNMYRCHICSYTMTYMGTCLRCSNKILASDRIDCTSCGGEGEITTISPCEHGMTYSHYYCEHGYTSQHD